MATNWRQQQKAQLRERLYSVALELFRQGGYEQTTVQQITERAGVSKGTFFNYFPGKEHVVAEWYRRIARDALAEVRGRRFPGAREAVSSLAQAMAAGGAAEPQLLDIKARIVADSDLLSDAERDQDAEMLAFILDRIVEGKRTDELDPDLDEKLFATLVVRTLTGTAHEWVISRHGFDLPEAVRESVFFLFRAAGRTGS